MLKACRCGNCNHKIVIPMPQGYIFKKKNNKNKVIYFCCLSCQSSYEKEEIKLIKEKRAKFVKSWRRRG